MESRPRRKELMAYAQCRLHLIRQMNGRLSRVEVGSAQLNKINQRIKQLTKKASKKKFGLLNTRMHNKSTTMQRYQSNLVYLLCLQIICCQGTRLYSKVQESVVSCVQHQTRKLIRHHRTLQVNSCKINRSIRWKKRLGLKQRLLRC